MSAGEAPAPGFHLAQARQAPWRNLFGLASFAGLHRA